MNLIGRYIFREAFGSWLVVMLVLFVIFMTNQLADILGDAAADRLPRDAVLAIFGLTALRYLMFLTPITLFLGVMLALARLNRDGEMAALSACGVGLTRLLVPIGAFTLLLALGLTWLALVSTPAANRRVEEIRFSAEQNVELSAIEPGKFVSPDSGETVIYAKEVVGDELRDVFLQTQQGDRVTVILAERGRRVVDATEEQSFMLYKGRRYEGVPGESEFLRLEFDEGVLPIRPDEEEEFVELAAAKPTLELLRSSRLGDRAELQWRVSFPLQLFVLSLLAVPLSRTSPREGRYARLGMALLIYLIYFDMLSIARVWMERGLIGDDVGMWWVHAIAALVALLMLARAGGWLVRARP
ncbi:MAG TPA: LPS export ABC transporter permease LptF, partial [Gammaproteobacteria bacterium]|nr:LPS export ABC transporter permease LptF [Gammaproteobacteria bacterium]